METSLPPMAGWTLAHSKYVERACSAVRHTSCSITRRTLPPRACAALPPPRIVMRGPSVRSRGSRFSSIQSCSPSR